MARPGVRLPTVTLYADRHEIQTAYDKAYRPWICLTCGEQFNLMDNMGSLECHQHPGYIQQDERWSCCGQKIYRVQWAQNHTHQRFLSCSVGKPPYSIPPKVRGCQPCDHNTSTKPYTHKDAQEIAELSALLPFMNKKFPFELRNGFDNGVLRRCAKRAVHFPPKPPSTAHNRPYSKTTLTYIDNNGHIENGEYNAYEQVPILEGMELNAVHVYGDEDDTIQIPVTLWWPKSV